MSVSTPTSNKTVTPSFSFGIKAARQGLKTPCASPTLYMVPTSIAPELPAEANVSIFPFFKKLKPTAKDESGFTLNAFIGESCMSMTSLQSTMVSEEGSQFSCKAIRSISLLRPKRTNSSSEERSCSAEIAPLTIASGAKSPPITSKPILILVRIDYLSSFFSIANLPL